MFYHLFRYFNKKTLRNPPSSLRVLILMAAILLYGTTGFLYFELAGNPELTWLDGLWYTLVTMTTVGYGDFFPKTPGGRLLVGAPIMLFGIGILGYALSIVATVLVTSKTKEIRGMSSFNLKDHLVIFNFSSLSKVEQVLTELALDPTAGATEVVLVDDVIEELPIELQKKGVHFIRGNPTRDETLQRTGIDRARHAVLLTRNPSDPASDNLNVAIALAIEGRCKNVNTVVECMDPSSEELLRKAGCDHIVCSNRFDAHFISQELLNPGIQYVLSDLMTSGKGQQFYLVPIVLGGNFEEIARRCREKGHIPLGLSNPDQSIQLNPAGDQQALKGARLITIGPSRLASI